MYVYLPDNELVLRGIACVRGSSRDNENNIASSSTVVLESL